MKKSTFVAHASGVIVALTVVMLFCGEAVAQTAKAQGLITRQSGDTMTVQTPDSANLVVVLTDNTEVAQIQGVFKARRGQMSMAALIPGLQVQVEGAYNTQN
jgi:hypothetical protein